MNMPAHVCKENYHRHAIVKLISVDTEYDACSVFFFFERLKTTKIWKTNKYY